MPEKTNYALGYSERMSRYMARRRAATHVAFFADALQPDWHVLDCGCGPGSISLDLASIVCDGRVVAIDHEPVELERARSLASERGVGNVEFKQCDVCSLPFEDASFDAVLMHATLSHVKEPQVALSEAARVVKPGGLIGVRDADWDGNVAHPMNETLVRSDEVFVKLLSAGGSNIKIGRLLAQLLAQAGFTDVRTSATYEVFAEDDLREFVGSAAAFWALDKVVAGAQAIAGLTAEDIESIQAELVALGEQPNAFFAHAWFEVIANKPTDAA